MKDWLKNILVAGSAMGAGVAGDVIYRDTKANKEAAIAAKVAADNVPVVTMNDPTKVYLVTGEGGLKYPVIDTRTIADKSWAAEQIKQIPDAIIRDDIRGDVKVLIIYSTNNGPRPAINKEYLDGVVDSRSRIDALSNLNIPVFFENNDGTRIFMGTTSREGLVRDNTTTDIIYGHQVTTITTNEEPGKIRMLERGGEDKMKINIEEGRPEDRDSLDYPRIEVRGGGSLVSLSNLTRNVESFIDIERIKGSKIPYLVYLDQGGMQHVGKVNHQGRFEPNIKDMQFVGKDDKVIPKVLGEYKKKLGVEKTSDRGFFK